ncbi:MAG: hypothetical protein WAM97_14705 [Acidimicrobiales bacterium]
MAVSDGADGSDSFARSVIVDAPGMARFEGVWLIGEAWGRQAASANVGVVLDSTGLTVTGPAPGQSNKLPWTWVQHFGPGSPMSFPDGSRATVVKVALVGRTITLLVPPDQLRDDEIEGLNRHLPDYQGSVADPSPMEATITPAPVLDPPEQTSHSDKASHSGHSDKTSHSGTASHKEKTGWSEKTASSGSEKPVTARGEMSLRNFRLAVLLLGLVVVAVIGTIVVAVRIHSNNQGSTSAAVLPQSPPTTQAPMPSTLTGPPASASAATIASQVNLNLSDLPTGWSAITIAPSASVPSPFANVQTTANADLASCVRLPLSHLGIITGATEPGGTQVWPSQSFNMNAGLKPSAISVTSLESSVGIEQADLSAFVAPGVARCLDDYYASNFAADHITSAPIVNRFAVPQHAGEEVIGLDVHIGISPGGRPQVYDYDVVIIGSGRLEIALGAQQNNEPFPIATLDQSLQGIESRAAEASAGS